MNLYRLTIVAAILSFPISLGQLFAAKSLSYPAYDPNIENMHRYNLTSPVTPLRSGGIMDYRFSRVADAKYETTVSIESVLDDIKSKILSSTYPVENLTLSLSENYLTEAGFKQLVDYLLHSDNKDVIRAIKHIDLSNNRIKATAQDDINRLLKANSALTLDLSINYFSLSDLSRLTSEEKTKITDRSY
jgi:hypothetical protein